MDTPNNATTREAVDVAKSLTSAIRSTSEKSGRNIEIRQIVDEVFDTNRNLKSKSVLSQKQVVAAAIAYAMADALDSDELRDVTNYLLELKISHAGIGRGNLEKILSALALRDEDTESKQRGLLRRVIGF